MNANPFERLSHYHSWQKGVCFIYLNPMNCVILQPSYIPWRGFFHQVHKADVFIFYDDVQFDKRGWRNRNQIKTAQGLKWLTIPVYNKGHQTQHTPINQIQICWDRPWNHEHWTTIKLAYSKAPFFNKYAQKIEDFYCQHPDSLSDFTIDFSIYLSRELGISHTSFMRSSDLHGIEGVKTDRLINILKAVEATHYISGPAAQDYIDEETFQKSGISLEYMHYDYPSYPQLYPPFESHVSILDLLFMTGPDAMNYILPG